MAYIIGRVADLGGSSRVVRLTIAMLIADAVLFVFGFAWLVLVLANLKGVGPAIVLPGAFAKAVQPFLVWDALKMVFAAVSVTGLWTLFKKRS